MVLSLLALATPIIGPPPNTCPPGPPDGPLEGDDSEDGPLPAPPTDELSPLPAVAAVSGEAELSPCSRVPDFVSPPLIGTPEGIPGWPAPAAAAGLPAPPLNPMPPISICTSPMCSRRKSFPVMGSL